MFVLNYLYFLALCLFSIIILFRKKAVVRHPLEKKRRLYFEGPELFWTLTFSTGLLALSAPAGLDLMAIRLFFLEALCLIGLFLAKGHPQWLVPMVIYFLYLFWLLIGLTYSPSPLYGIRVLLKYLYPLLIMLFSSAVVHNYEVFLKASLGARIIAFAGIFSPYLGFLIPGVYWYPTALAINFIAMSIFSLALYVHGGKNKRDLYFSILFMLPCIVWVFRTSIMGTTLALMTFFFFRYKLKSLPFIFGMLLLFVCSIFFIPSVKEKMFRDKDTSIDALRSGQINADDIDSNGRFAMWEWALDNFYDEHEVIGSGTGNLQEVFYSLKHPFHGIRICHNDYVQILCDNGLIGIVLFIGCFLSLIIHCFIMYQDKRNSKAIKICVITAGASTAGMLLTMYTDNVINYTMATLAYPCGFYGMALGMKHYHKTLSR